MSPMASFLGAKSTLELQFEVTMDCYWFVSIFYCSVFTLVRQEVFSGLAGVIFCALKSVLNQPTDRDGQVRDQNWVYIATGCGPLTSALCRVWTGPPCCLPEGPFSPSPRCFYSSCRVCINWKYDCSTLDGSALWVWQFSFPLTLVEVRGYWHWHLSGAFKTSVTGPASLFSRVCQNLRLPVCSIFLPSVRYRYSRTRIFISFDSCKHEPK